MSPADLLAVILMCAPNVAPATLQSIVNVESHGNPYAIGVNADVHLARQPANADEAVAWARWLRANGYNFDAGLGQVNSANWDRLGITAETVFQPCTNIRGAAKILADNYRWALKTKAPGADALLAAVSAYNTGDLKAGFRNGYVRRFVTALSTAAPGAPTTTIEAVPPLAGRAPKPAVRIALAKARAHTNTRLPPPTDAANWQGPSGWQAPSQSPSQPSSWQAPSQWGVAEITDANSTATNPRNP